MFVMDSRGREDIEHLFDGRVDVQPPVTGEQHARFVTLTSVDKGLSLADILNALDGCEYMSPDGMPPNFGDDPYFTVVAASMGKYATVTLDDRNC